MISAGFRLTPVRSPAPAIGLWPIRLRKTAYSLREYGGFYHRSVVPAVVSGMLRWNLVRGP